MTQEPDFFTNVRPPEPEEQAPVVPERLKRRPWSERHKTHVPWFVEEINGVYDFRVVKVERMAFAITRKLCWICGGSLGQHAAFNIGTVSMITRTTSEPPSHRECAIYAARTCPFLSNPRKEYRDGGITDEAIFHESAVRRNPGVAVVWICGQYVSQPEMTKDGWIYLLTIGQPSEVLGYANGKRATRVEIEASISEAVVILQERASLEGPSAIAALSGAIDQAMALLPMA